MLTSVVSYLLQSYIGKYVENFNSENVSLGLLRGDLALENLPLKKDALLDIFDLPVVVKSGYIGKITLRIPYTQPRSQPWVFLIERLYAVVGPSGPRPYDEEAEAKKEAENKAKLLAALEAKWWQKQEEQQEGTGFGASWMSYGTTLAYNFVQNVQVVINDVHIRFEDDVTQPESPFAFGIRINQFSAQTTDPEGNASNPRTDSELTYKLLDLQGFSLYLDSGVIITTKLDIDGVKQTLAQSSETQYAKEHSFILRPVNLTGNLKRYTTALPLRSPSTPRIELSLGLKELSVALTQRQYKAMVALINDFDRFDRQRQHRKFRPTLPVKQDPRSWWKFAIDVQVRQLSCRTASQMVERARQTIAYVHSYEAYLLAGLEVPGGRQMVGDTDRERVETEWNVGLLLALRELAIERASRHLVRYKASKPTSPSSTPTGGTPQLPAPAPKSYYGWWGWMGRSGAPSSSPGATPTTPEGEDLFLNEKEMTALTLDIDKDTLIKRDAVFARLQFTLETASFSLVESKDDGEDVPLVTLEGSSLRIGFESRPRYKSLLFTASIGSLCLRDQLTLHSIFPVLVAPQRQRLVTPIPPAGRSRGRSNSCPDHSYLFSCLYELNPRGSKADYRFEVTTDPLQIVYNSQLLHRVTGFFKVARSTLYIRATARQHYQTMRARTKANIRTILDDLQDPDAPSSTPDSPERHPTQRGGRESLRRRTSKRWTIKLDISAPQILIPDSFTRVDTSCVLYDFGKLTLNNTAPNMQHAEVFSPLPGQIETPEEDDESDDDFLTPCSSPLPSDTEDDPVGETAPPLRPSNLRTPSSPTSVADGAQEAVEDPLYEAYSLSLVDLEILVGRVVDMAKVTSLESVCRLASSSGSLSNSFNTSAELSRQLHLVNKFSVTVLLKRRLVSGRDPDYPSIIVNGKMPSFLLQLTDSKVWAFNSCMADLVTSHPDDEEVVSIASTPERPAPVVDTSGGRYRTLSSSKSGRGRRESLRSSGSGTRVRQPHKIMEAKFSIGELIVQLESRGCAVAEFKLSGAEATWTHLYGRQDIDLCVKSLIVADAISNLGQDFDLLVASHGNVCLDSLSGSINISQPRSPNFLQPPFVFSPSVSPNTTPIVPQGSNSSANTLSPHTSISVAPSDTTTLQEEEEDGWEPPALIKVHYEWIDACPEEGEDLPSQNLEVNFNNLDIIGNQETLVEIVSFFNRINPATTFRQRKENAAKATQQVIKEKLKVHTEAKVFFDRLNLLLIRIVGEELEKEAKKIGTITLSGAYMEATMGDAEFISMNLKGLQVLDLTCEDGLHRHIVTVGTVGPTQGQDGGPGFLYPGGDQSQALTCTIYHESPSPSLHTSPGHNTSRQQTPPELEISAQMASVCYVHSPYFIYQMSKCVDEFRDYTSRLARRLRDAATHVVTSVINPTSSGPSAQDVGSMTSLYTGFYSTLEEPRSRNQSMAAYSSTGFDIYDQDEDLEFSTMTSCFNTMHSEMDNRSISRSTLLPSAADVCANLTAPPLNPSSSSSTFIRLSVHLETPVIVWPKARNSQEVLVGHLGNITLTNRASDLGKDAETTSSESENSDSDSNVGDIYARGETQRKGRKERQDPYEWERNGGILLRCSDCNVYALSLARYSNCTWDKILQLYRKSNVGVSVVNNTSITIKVSKFTRSCSMSASDEGESSGRVTCVRIKARIVDPLEVRLSKWVYQQILASLDNLVYDDEEGTRSTQEETEADTETQTSGQETSQEAPTLQSAATSPVQIQMDFQMPRLSVEMICDLGDGPQGLARLTMNCLTFRLTKPDQHTKEIDLRVHSLVMQDMVSPDQRYLIESFGSSAANKRPKSKRRRSKGSRRAASGTRGPLYRRAESCPNLFIIFSTEGGATQKNARDKEAKEWLLRPGVSDDVDRSEAVAMPTTPNRERSGWLSEVNTSTPSGASPRHQRIRTFSSTCPTPPPSPTNIPNSKPQRYRGLSSSPSFPSPAIPIESFLLSLAKPPRSSASTLSRREQARARRSKPSRRIRSFSAGPTLTAHHWSKGAAGMASNTTKAGGETGTSANEEERAKSRQNLVHIRAKLVDKKSPVFVTLYNSTNRFIEVDFNSLTCHLNFDTWVLLLDFLGLGSKIHDTDEVLKLNDVTKMAPGYAKKADGEDEDIVNSEIEFSVNSFTLVLSKPEYELARARIADFNSHINLCDGNMNLTGRLGVVQLEDSSPNGCVYRQRFVTAASNVCLGPSESCPPASKDPLLEFTMFKYGLPDPGLTRNEDMRVSVRLAPIYYLHTQYFLSELAAFLHNFLNFQDIIGRAQAATAGKKLQELPPRGSRMRLDVQARAPIILLPQHAASDQLLVIDLGTFSLSNRFLWHNETGTLQTAVFDCDSLVVQPSSLIDSPEKPTTRTEFVGRHDLFSGPGPVMDAMTRGFYGQSSIPSSAAALNDQGVETEATTTPSDSSNQRCLLDSMEMVLADMDLYMARRYTKELHSERSVSEDQLVFADFVVCAYGARPLEEKCNLRLTAERNLDGDRCHLAPDWKIRGQLSRVACGLTSEQYSVVRGILAHNLGEDTTEIQRAKVFAHFPEPEIQTILTGKVWKGMSFGIDLLNVTVSLLDEDSPSNKASSPGNKASEPSNKASAPSNKTSTPSNKTSTPSNKSSTPSNKAFSSPDSQSKGKVLCRVDFIRSRLLYESFSDETKVTELGCSEVRFNDTRFTHLPVNNRPNVFTTILQPTVSPSPSTLPSPSVMNPSSEDCYLATSPPAPSTQMQICFRSTDALDRFYIQLNQMRLMVIFDWLLAVKNFLSTSPDEPHKLLDEGQTHRASAMNSSADPKKNPWQRLGLDDPFQSSASGGPPATPPKKPMDIILTVVGTEFVVVESAANWDTNAVILKGSARLSHRPQTSTRPLFCSLEHLEVFSCCLAAEEETALSIVDPLTLTLQVNVSNQDISSWSTGAPPTANVHRTSRGLQDVLDEKLPVLEFWFSTIKLRLSYNDLKLFLSILASLPHQTASHPTPPSSLISEGGGQTRTSPPANLKAQTAEVRQKWSVDAIRQLESLGYPKSRCREAIDLCKGDVNAAALHLSSSTSNTKPLSASDVTADDPRKTSFIGKFSRYASGIKLKPISDNTCISLCIIDDCLDADVPLAEIQLKDLKFDWKLTGVRSGRACFVLSADYYNRNLSGWEPFVEPWKCDFDWREEYSSKKLNYVLGVNSTDVFDIDLTLPLLDLFNQTKDKWAQGLGTMEITSLPSPSHTLSSHATPSHTSVLATQAASMSLESGGTAIGPKISNSYTTLPQQMSMDQLAGMGHRRRVPFVPFRLVNKTGSPLYFKTITASNKEPISAPVSGGYELVDPDADQLGFIPTGYDRQSSVRNMQTSSSSPHLSSLSRSNPTSLFRQQPMTQSLTTSEEWVRVDVDEQANLIFRGDLGQDKLRHERDSKRRDHRVIVRVDGWEPSSPVAVDILGVFFRDVQPAVKKYPSMSQSATRIVFEVRREGTAQKLVTVRSALQVSNCLRERVEVKMEAPGLGADGSRSKSVLIESGEILSLPMTQVYSKLLVRPISNQWAACNFADTPIIWNQVEKPGDVREFVTCCRPRGVDESSESCYWICVVIYRDLFPSQPSRFPGHCVYLKSPLLVTNLLPVEMLFYLKGTAVKLRVQPGEDAAVHVVGNSQMIEFGVSLDQFDRCDPLIIPPYSYNHTVLMRIYDSNKRILELQVEVVSGSNGARRLTISAPYWLVNQCSLPLVFSQYGTTDPAAGQFSEHEVARSLVPHMFSFSSHQDGLLLIVRIGNGYRNSDSLVEQTDLRFPWSTRISIDKEGVDTIQLKVMLNDNRPDWVFNIGVEVRRGRGRYQNTTIVTFKSRYILENQSRSKLLFAQRHLVQGSNHHDPVGAGSHSFLMFHWPRQDLDPLLCVRPVDLDPAALPSPHANSASSQTGHEDNAQPIMRWSGGFRIDRPDSFHIIMRSDIGFNYFLRVGIVLQGATFYVVFSDVDHLPLPYRIDNLTDIVLLFHQTKNQSTDARYLVRGQTSIDYTWDEPTLPPHISLTVQGGSSATYNLNVIGQGDQLFYQNFIYIVMTATEGTNKELVFDVNENKEIYLNEKIPGRRSQLWWVSPTNELFHEGSAPPRDPRSYLDRTTSLLLDVATLAAQPAEIGKVVKLKLARPDPRRERLQRWRFTADGCLMNKAKSYVQARSVREGSQLVAGYSQVGDPRPPDYMAITHHRLRPGSGCLDVNVITDGPTRVLRIEDTSGNAKGFRQRSEEGWLCVDILEKKPPPIEDPELQQTLEVNINLTRGIGISLINDTPEELIYASISGIQVSYFRTQTIEKVDAKVNKIQIDNQLLTANLPILLYTPNPKPGRKAGSSDTQQLAITSGEKETVFSLVYDRAIQTKWNAFIFNNFIMSIRRLSIELEERLLLHLIKFFRQSQDITSPSPPSGSNVDLIPDSEKENEYQKNQAAATFNQGRRLYFGNLKISTGDLLLSVQTSTNLPPDIKEMKTFIPSLMSFANAQISLQPFKVEHFFETHRLLMQDLSRHYQIHLRQQAIHIFGSVDFLGNPVGFISDITEGISGLVDDFNVTGLVKNVTHGVTDSTAKVIGSMSQLVTTISMDKRHQAERNLLLEEAGKKGGIAHLSAGWKGLSHGVKGGMASIFTQPYQGFNEEGIGGFVLGFGKGMIGTVTKPVGGVLDLITGAVSSIREVARSSSEGRPTRVRRPRSCVGLGRLMPPYSPQNAEAQEVLARLSGVKEMRTGTDDGEGGEASGGAGGSASGGLMDGTWERLLTQKTVQSTRPDEQVISLVSNKSVHFLRITGNLSSRPTVMFSVSYRQLADCRVLTTSAGHPYILFFLGSPSSTCSSYPRRSSISIEHSSGSAPGRGPQVRCDTLHIANSLVKDIQEACGRFREENMTLSSLHRFRWT